MSLTKLHEDNETIEADVYFQRFFPAGISSDQASESIHRICSDLFKALWETYETAQNGVQQPTDVVVQVGLSPYPGTHRSARRR